MESMANLKFARPNDVQVGELPYRLNVSGLQIHSSISAELLLGMAPRAIRPRSVLVWLA